ncbi:steroid monooxygenase [Talaromyces proteolyticus]|uniref:Steroid monooxygenase n=1 Tax=Talaromyces proteolyticus TaxID=1131652 RepID=A0AAD4L0B6_9EURO|nr:steroid monooxygenase [Talaromyces proteolyticus]KAH8701505.1 steroid monooxygenase [Talaromyces proteolyticus]
MEDRPRVYGWPTSKNGYTIQEVPSGTKRFRKAIVIGAGASGLSFAKFQQERMIDFECVIYEKNDEVSGTWTENRYPGCACDIPSVTYQYPWELKIWSRFYAYAPEILEYFKHVADKHGLRKFIKLQHEVIHAQWDNQSGKWCVKVRNLTDGTEFDDTADVLVNASGIFNYWQWPNIKGRKDFKGIVVHSANYPTDLDLAGKRVAVVGTGASGLQLTAALQPVVSHLYTWIRSGTWITSSFGSTFAGPDGGNFQYSKEQKEKFIHKPDVYLKYIKDVEKSLSDPLAVLKNTPITHYAQEFSLSLMKDKLRDHPDLLEALTPTTFPVGCKRRTPGNGYLEAITQSNVTTYCKASLDELTEEGFIDPNGNKVEIDAIVFATGFNTTWVPRFPIIANGKNLQDIYAENALSYMGVAAPYMPNYFTFYGPYSPIGQSSVLPMMDVFSRWILQMIEKMQIEDIKSLTPKKTVIEDYGEHTKLLIKRFVWDAPCRSWMKAGSIETPPSSYAGTRTQVMELLAQPRFEDFDIEYKNQNRWQWLGNGFSIHDVDGSDNTWFWGTLKESIVAKASSEQKNGF